MFSSIMNFLLATAILLSACTAINIPADPPSGTIELTPASSGWGWIMTLNIPIEANSFTDTTGTAHIGGPESYTSFDMHINYTDTTGWTIWAVPTSVEHHLVIEPLTAVWIFRTLPAADACGSAPIGSVNDLTYPGDYEVYNDCGNGGYPVFHDAAYGFAVSLNEPVTISNF
ncbi:hypothetical protein CALVIDRAFT_537659 [Calocera viscosa TUFC12733]|uniref:Uncharacterized protein n=1 Tax=Calocera viscosa (strain TUFC12733) TaxID=1330018 RepID=A0A167LVJ6_CALVF|nr:hypothetical protein CALVIDRAFT_537659 [Calocera viscosa TUFC12733]